MSKMVLCTHGKNEIHAAVWVDGYYRCTHENAWTMDDSEGDFKIWRNEPPVSG